MKEPHEVTSGHFALFDAFWRTTSGTNVDDSVGVGVLHMNECPPKVTVTSAFGEVTITRAASRIDIDEAIIHVENTHQADVVATNAEATAGQLSLEEYPSLRAALGLGRTDPVPAGTKVWWLQLDDPDTASDETSELRLGFSTALFDSQYWHRPGSDANGNPHKAMRYKLEVESYPADPDDPGKAPYFFT